MSRLLDALGIFTGKVALWALIIFIGGLNIFHLAFTGMLMFVAAVSAAFFSRWLKDRGTLLESPSHHEFAKHCKLISIVLGAGVFLRFVLPALIPGPAAWAKTIKVSMESYSQKAALEGLAPKEVPCGAVLIGPNREIIYHYLPGEYPLKCYDKAGEHPQGRGKLLPVTLEIAQIITQQQQHMAIATPVVPTQEQILELVRVEVAKARPTSAPVSTEDSASPPPTTPKRGTWLSTDSARN
jgi:hypothetical protein